MLKELDCFKHAFEETLTYDEESSVNVTSKLKQEGRSPDKY